MRRIWLVLAVPSLFIVAHCTGDDPALSNALDDGGANDGTTSNDAPSSDAGADSAPDAAPDSPPDAPPSGTFDESFENGVKTAVTVNFGLAVAVDRLSRVYVAGNQDKCVSTTSRYDMAVLRFTATGAVDTTWGTAGRLCIDFGPENGDTARAIAIDSADKVIVVGESITVPGLTTRIAIARINSDGTLDGTFGTGGRFRADDAATDLVFPFAVAIDSVVTYVGASNGVSPGQRTKGVLLRVTGSGTLDPAFNQNTIGGGGGPGYLTDTSARAFFGVTVAGGNVFVAGSTLGTRSFIVRKYSSNGLRDATFGTDGAVVTPTSAGSDEARAVAVGSGSVVAAGVSGLASSVDDGQGPTTAAMYSATGALVTTFGTSGVAKVEPAWLTGNQATGLLLDPDGRIVLGGVVDAGSVANQFDMAVTRLAPNGTVDTSFGEGGVTRSGLPESDVLYGMARDPITKKIVVLGSDAFTRVVLYRLHP